MSGRYPFPWRVFFDLARSLPSGHRSLSYDAASLVARMDPPPCVESIHHLPLEGPVILVANHFQLRGMWIGWAGAAITNAVDLRRGGDPPLHWLVTGGLRLMQWKRSGPEIPGAARLFAAVAGVYGMVALPLVSGRGRAGAVREWLQTATGGGVAGIFPEGLDGRGDHLRPAERGFGPVCRIAARAGVPIVPCGVHRAQDRLVLRFGPVLAPARLLSDGDPGEQVMRALAALLPPEMRGVYTVGS